MLMTEEEAKSRWCPHARQTGVTNRDGGMCATANRSSSEHYGVENCNCIGSACMAWRWANLPDPKGVDIGYCGAFGQPSA